ncbi:hypothetical protein QL285_021095 [Trifolium repens]|nr:hypothetical protein QL285_021095 [Trifolium repens]
MDLFGPSRTKSIGGVDTLDILKDKEVVGSDQSSTEVPKEKEDKPSPFNDDKDDGGSSSSKNHHKQRGAGLAKEWRTLKNHPIDKVLANNKANPINKDLIDQNQEQEA